MEGRTRPPPRRPLLRMRRKNKKRGVTAREKEREVMGDAMEKESAVMAGEKEKEPTFEELEKKTRAKLESTAQPSTGFQCVLNSKGSIEVASTAPVSTRHGQQQANAQAPPGQEATKGPQCHKRQKWCSL